MTKIETLGALLTPPRTLVLVHGEEMECDEERGLKPLLKRVNTGRNYRGWCAADQVVGRAAAFLYVLLGVDGVYAEMISDGAVEVLNRYHIPFAASTRVEKILNRTRSDICPMERATTACKTPEDALASIRAALEKMRAGN